MGLSSYVLLLLEKEVHMSQASESLGYRFRSLGPIGFWTWPVVGPKNLYLYLDTHVKSGLGAV